MLAKTSTCASSAIATSTIKQQPTVLAKDNILDNSSIVWASHKRHMQGSDMRLQAVNQKSKSSTLTGVIFEPFNEVQNDLFQVSNTSTKSLACQRFHDPCKAALNEQINIEYNVSYIYHALFVYFDRDNVMFPGFAKYLKDASDEECGHAKMLMKYQLALSLEKLTNEKLLNLHKVVEDCKDVQMIDYIEGNFLAEQVAAIKKVSDYVSQLRRIGKGHGVWHFDQMLLDGPGAGEVNGPSAGAVAP